MQVYILMKLSPIFFFVFTSDANWKGQGLNKQGSVPIFNAYTLSIFE